MATAFLTRVPVRARVEGPADLAGSLPWFPVVGAAIGATVGVVRWSSGLVLPHLVAATVAVAAGVALTGALHEDGMADTVDGLGGGRGRESTLDIMRDPRIGVYGAAALMVTLLMRAGLLAALVDVGVIGASAAAGAASRAVVAAWMARAPSAAPGLGADFLGGVKPVQAAVASGLGLAASLWLGVAGLLALGMGVLVSWAVVGWSMRRIGGLTGDVLGAVQVLTELAFLSTLVAAPGAWHW